MTTVPITVSIPVGPHPSNTRWLKDALASIEAQTVKPAEILLIDDGANLLPANVNYARIWQAPWSLGVAHAFNFGVALAENNLVVMMGSDDELMSTCIEQCWAAWERINDPHGYYYMALRYDDGREQNTPCNAAMVHKDLWRLTGGFPIEASIGACDTMLLSIMMASQGRLGNIHSIGDEPIYWYRAHEETDTNVRRARWHELVAVARNLLIAERAR